jgi:sugar phosphate isomerase/epimerase
MAIGISTHAYRWTIAFGQIDHFNLIDRACDAGAEVIQICHNLPLEPLPETTLLELAQVAAGKGIILEVGTKGDDPATIRRSIRTAQIVGSRILRLVMGEKREASVNEQADMIRSLLPDLVASGVTLAFENHFGLAPAEIAWLIHDIDHANVRACPDPLNSISRLVGPAETLLHLAPLAASVHVKDAVVIPWAQGGKGVIGFNIRGCPVGDGLLDIPELMRAVWSSGRSPHFLVELWMERLESEEETLTKEETWIRAGISFLKKTKLEIEKTLGSKEVVSGFCRTQVAHYSLAGS